MIDVIDNGIGLPKVSRARLLEPYVTTREKGTGLGLAIVGRVLEDHGGRIELQRCGGYSPGRARSLDAAAICGLGACARSNSEGAGRRNKTAGVRNRGASRSDQ